ncbi:hypothetical protein SAMN05216480_110121 [Pustulibacterium marinum]|uniref:Uncharacterized protein n=1 Tax=Pustulibacterium marinum TaxID=1224947 RepID=A0A1I7HPX1_9FLAO|nr:hypothetical protein SAMN05216480_110121 [Pustulibacterium marinum]
MLKIDNYHFKQTFNLNKRLILSCQIICDNGFK